MSRGRKSALTVELTHEEHVDLLRSARSTAAPMGVARRARIILEVAQGRPITTIARETKIARRFVYKWVQRFVAERMGGLRDRRGGRPRHGVGARIKGSE